MESERKREILEELGGIPEEVYDDLVKEFLDQARTEISAIRESLKKGISDEAAQLAHSIKGAAANLRLEEISDLAKNIELGLREGAETVSFSGIAEKLEKKIIEYENK